MTFSGDTREVLPTIATNLHDFYDNDYGEIVKGSGEYMVTLRVVKMWKYRKRWKFRYHHNQCKNNNFISVTWQDLQIGKIKKVKWTMSTIKKEEIVKERWHLPTVSPYLQTVILQKRRGINSLIASSWNCRDLVFPRKVQVRREIISIHAVDRQVNEAAHLTTRHFRFLSCPKCYVVFKAFIPCCINVSCNR